MRHLPRPSGILVLVLIGALAPAVLAGELEDFTQRITEELRSIDEEAAAAFEQANAARDREDLAEAERLYGEVRSRQPQFFHATRRLCNVLARQGRRAESLSLCREALGAAATTENRVGLLEALTTLEEGKQLTSPERAEALRLAGYLEKTEGIDPKLLPVLCQTSIAVQDLDMLRRCVRRLERETPDDLSTHYFAWVLGMSEGDFATVERALERARAAGLPEDVYQSMLAQVQEARPITPKLLRIGAWIGAVWLVGLLALFVVGSLLSSAALRAARQPPVRSGEPIGLAGGLRRAYRAVLWWSCVYYYLSIPIVLAVVVLAGGGAIYGFLSIGRVPIKLVLIAAIIVLVTLWAVLKSFFIRARDEDPGDRLDTGGHPRMRAVLDEVAGQIGTRPVDNVYITPGTDLAVMERGGILRQLRGASERCLILGVGVLEGMKLGPFKAILAHEYGHFSNRDTAGGGFALVVRRSLLTMGHSLAAGGAATWYNPAWWFVNGFYRIFLRISQGASRLQEVLADRWAAFAYGAQAFERGLRHVIERAIRFDTHSGSALEEVVEGGKPLANLYTYEPVKRSDEASITGAVAEALRREPSPYDSHPSPAMRFELVHALDAPGEGNMADAEEDAWSLFRDRDALERWMTDRVRENIAAAHGVNIPREATP